MAEAKTLARARALRKTQLRLTSPLRLISRRTWIAWNAAAWVFAALTLFCAPDWLIAQDPGRASGVPGRSAPNAPFVPLDQRAAVGRNAGRNAVAQQDVPPIEQQPAAGLADAGQPNGAQNGWAGGFQPQQMISPGGLSSTLNLLILLTVLSLAPSILMMTTCFVRFIVVLGLLRQALGTQQLPPNQVIIGLCLFLTFMVMGPVWQQSYTQGIKPYTNPEPGQEPLTIEQAFTRAALPIRRYMSEQIERTGNSDTVWLFLEYQNRNAGIDGKPDERVPETYDDVPLTALMPAFMLSELKTAFIIGFQLYLPFVVIDMVVAAVLMSMGMMMLPPTLISFPFKLLLFVLIDGLYLTVGMMLESVRPFG